jgi:hypothetical protein
MNLPRGYRNCNPGNIRKTTTMWIGLADNQRDSVFYTFRSMAYGYRAMFRILKNYNILYGLSTIQEIITRWAPPSENDTQAYIKNVAHDMNKDSNYTINFDDVSEMCAIVAAISHQENGIQPSMEEVYEGWELI